MKPSANAERRAYRIITHQKKPDKNKWCVSTEQHNKNNNNNNNKAYKSSLWKVISHLPETVTAE